MSTQKNLKNWELNDNPLKERIKLLMSPDEIEKPYSFASRVGLSKSTFTGIWIEGRDSLHKSTIDKICTATGANPAWLATGIGEPFESPDTINKPVQKEAPSINKLNTNKLTKALETAERALEITNSTMKPEQYAALIASLYFTEQSNGENQKLLVACTKLIQTALKETQRTMSPSSKSELISVIYNYYIGEQWSIDSISSTLNQLIKSVN